MSTFRDTLLADVSGICQRLYEHRLTSVREQTRVSEKAKADIRLLIAYLHELFLLDPFPDESKLDATPVSSLQQELEQADHDPASVEERLLDWVRTVSPAAVAALHEEDEAADGTAATTTAALANATTPINQRLIDDLHTFRGAMDRTRVRLLRDRDRYDRAEYTAARNAFTLARAAYEERLRLNQVTATNEDCAELEQILLPAVVNADGATFPGAIQAAADFASRRIFA